MTDSDNGDTTYIGRRAVPNAFGKPVDSFIDIKYAKVQERYERNEMTLNPSDDADVVNGIKDATKFGPACAQPASLDVPGGSEEEDCLYLNLWVPSEWEEGDEPLAVMVYMHGGGLSVGSGFENSFLGDNLAGNGNVIVATMNYRLGTFGFMPTSNDGTGTGCMNGLLDVMEALKWIQNRISYFGGDPELVTIFGESAGGDIVGLLNVSPLAKGLFKRSIMLSGNAHLPYPEDGEKMVQDLLQEAGCPLPPCTIEDLKALTVQQVLESPFSSSIVCYDTNVIPGSDPIKLYREGPINPTDMIIGANTFDDDALPSVGIINPQTYIDEADVSKAISYFIGIGFLSKETSEEAKTDAILSAYSADVYNGSPVAAKAQFVGDLQGGVCLGRELTTMASGLVSGKVYNYYFGYLSDYDPANLDGSLLAPLGIDPDTYKSLLELAVIEEPNWASHGADLMFALGNPLQPGWPLLDDNIPLIEEIMARWANFARSGEPQVFTDGSSSDTWEPVNPGLVGSLEIAAKAASDPVYLYITGSGGTMVKSNKDKTKQCATIVPNLVGFSYSDSEDASSGPTYGNPSIPAWLAAWK